MQTRSYFWKPVSETREFFIRLQPVVLSSNQIIADDGIIVDVLEDCQEIILIVVEQKLSSQFLRHDRLMTFLCIGKREMWSTEHKQTSNEQHQQESLAVDSDRMIHTLQ